MKTKSLCRGSLDLERLADWFQRCRIRIVTRESTGVCWIPLFQILETRNTEQFQQRTLQKGKVKNRQGSLCGPLEEHVPILR